MSTTRSAIIIGLFSIASKVLGGVRFGIFAHYLGAGRDADIYVAAFRVPDLLFNLLVMGTLSVAFIPVFVEYLGRDRAEALKVADTIFNFGLLVMAGLAALGFLFAPLLVHLIVPGFDPAAKAATAAMTRVLLLSPIFFTLSSVLTSVLQSHKRFVIAAVAPLFYNLSIIAAVIYLYPRWGVTGLAWGAAAGAFLHFVIQFPAAIRLGLHPFKSFDLRNPGVRKIGKLFLPRVFGLDLGQITLLITSVIGSSLAAGSLANIYYAYDLETIPLGVVAVSFSVAAFPVFSEYFARRDFAAFRKFFAETAVQVLFLIIPISVFMLLLRAQIVRLILGAGQGTRFTFSDTRLTATALGFFVLSLFAQALIPILSRCFFALQNTVIPVVAGLVGAAVNILLALGLIRYHSPALLALAFSGAALINMAILFFLLHRRLGGLDDDHLYLSSIKISIASLAMAVATYISLYVVAPLVDMRTYFGIFTQTGAATVVAVLSYLASGLAIKLPESRQLVDILKNLFTKLTRPVTAAIVDTFTDMR